MIDMLQPSLQCIFLHLKQKSLLKQRSKVRTNKHEILNFFILKNLVWIPKTNVNP